MGCLSFFSQLPHYSKITLLSICVSQMWNYSNLLSSTSSVVLNDWTSCYLLTKNRLYMITRMIKYELIFFLSGTSEFVRISYWFWLWLWLWCFFDIWHVLVDFWFWWHLIPWRHIWNRRWNFLLSSALLLQKTQNHYYTLTIHRFWSLYVCVCEWPLVCVWPALALCSLWLVSSPSLLLLSSCSPHLKPWPCSQNEPSGFPHLHSLQETEKLIWTRCINGFNCLLEEMSQ